MFHRLAHVGVVAIGLAAMVVLGCGQRSPKGTAPAKKEDSKQKAADPAEKTIEPAEKQTPPPATNDPDEPAVKTADPAPADADETETDAEAASGSTGRAVGKLFKRMIEDSADPERGEAPRFTAPEKVAPAP